MTKNQIIAMVRKLIADEQATGFTDGGNLEEPEGTQELLNYLDRAVDEYSKRQAAANDIRLMKETKLDNNSNLPDDFLKFCGVIPVKVIGNKVKLYIQGTKISVQRHCDFAIRERPGDSHSSTGSDIRPE